MKNKTLLLTLSALLLGVTACNEPAAKTEEETAETSKNKNLEYNYSIRLVEHKPEGVTMPALQSYVVATNENDWLLFSGRTNQKDFNGGLHNQNANNYANESFPPKSFNTTLHVINLEEKKQHHITYDQLLATVTSTSQENKDLVPTGLSAKLSENECLFRASNPQQYQDGEFLYVVGGYGIDKLADSTAKNYHTFDKFVKIHVPTLIRLVKNDNDLSAKEWSSLFAFGSNPTLRATGGEMHMIDDYFYLAGGHDFNNSSQVYLNAVYKIDFINTDGISLEAKVLDTITDVPLDSMSNLKWMDSTSTFRRRDGPIVPCLYLTDKNELAKGINFYGGVFKYHFAAWNDAIHITPDNSDQFFTDSDYNQKNQNVYSCADLGLYDKETNEVHTFLPGGIGNGKDDGNLSAFTNSIGHATYNPNSKVSSFKIEDEFFPAEYFYGAEAEFILFNNIPTVMINGKNTNLINAQEVFKDTDEIGVGYIFGGIEAFESSPATYGSNKSGASNKLWKVILMREIK